MFTPGLRACGYKSASGLGKWPSRDPIGEKGSAKLYIFVANNPISKFDYLGLSWFCCVDICPYGAVRNLDAEIKIEPYGTTPTDEDGYDAQAKAIDNQSTGTDIIGYVTDPLGTIISNTTFNYGGLENTINTVMAGQSTFSGVWLFIRYKYEQCVYVTCVPKIWKVHTDWKGQPASSWTRGTIGQDQGLDAFTDSTDVDQHLKDNMNKVLKDVFGVQ